MSNDQSKGNAKDNSGKAKQASGGFKDDKSQDARGNKEQKFEKSQVRSGGANRDSGNAKNANAQSSGRN